MTAQQMKEEATQQLAPQLRILKSSGGNSDEACTGLINEVNAIASSGVGYTVLGSISFCVEYVLVSRINTQTQQVVTAALLLIVNPKIK